MPRKETKPKNPSTTKDRLRGIEEKQALWDEIEALNAQRYKRLTEDLWGQFDPRNEREVRLAAHFLHISEEEALRRYYISPDKSKEWSKSLSNRKITKEEFEEWRQQLREESRIQKETEEAIQSIRERGTTLRDMTIGVTTTKKLLAAVKKYGSIDETLQTFRNRTEKGGFKAIEPEMIPVVKVYGTGKDKAVLAILGYMQMKHYGDPKKAMTEKEVLTLKKDVEHSSEEDIEAYREAYVFYTAMIDTIPIVEYYRLDYMRAMVEVAKAITKYEGKKDIEGLIEHIMRQEENLPEDYKLTLTFPDIYKQHLAIAQQEIRALWDEVKELSGKAKRALSIFKGVLEGMYEAAISYGCLAILPYQFRAATDEITRYSRNLGISEFYLQDYLRELKNNGQKVTKAMEEIAVIPSFDETSTPEDNEGKEIVTLAIRGFYDREERRK